MQSCLHELCNRALRIFLRDQQYRTYKQGVSHAAGSRVFRYLCGTTRSPNRPRVDVLVQYFMYPSQIVSSSLDQYGLPLPRAYSVETRGSQGDALALVRSEHLCCAPTRVCIQPMLGVANAITCNLQLIPGCRIFTGAECVQIEALRVEMVEVPITVTQIQARTFN